MSDLTDRLRELWMPDAQEAADTIDRLTARLAVLEQDAARYRWLKPRVHGADFSYNDGDGMFCALVFRIPSDMRVSGNLDATINAALKGEG